MRPSPTGHAQYLLRFDDICPTMRWDVWEPAEAAMVRLGLKPILAVVPDNQDPKLAVDPPRPDFWERVRYWQSLGWTIALHGYQHRYVNKNPGMMKLNPQSEFAGLPREEQADKLRRGLAIFAEHGVRADAWVAPSHSFDQTTVELLAELGVPVVSDGMQTWPHIDSRGMVWIPQQLWGYRPKRRGVWTLCYHHNGWGESELTQFLREIEHLNIRYTDVSTIVRDFSSRRETYRDRMTVVFRMIWKMKLRQAASRFRRRLLDVCGQD